MDARTQQLLDDRAKHWATANDLRQLIEREDRDLTRDEEREWHRSLDVVERIDAQLGGVDGSTRAPVAIAGRGFGADEFRDGAPLVEGRSFVDFVQARCDVPEEHRDLDLGLYFRGMLTGNWKGAEAELRAMGGSVDTGGGYAIPAPLAGQILDLARNQTRVLQAGATVYPMTSRNLDIARLDGDPVPAWRAEHAAVTTDDATIGKVSLEAHSLALLVKISRELLEDAPNLTQVVGQAIAAQVALSVDFGALYGSGVDPQPAGVKNNANVGSTILGGGANGAAVADYAFVQAAMGELEDVNETPTAAITSPRVARDLDGLTDTTGQPLQPSRKVAALPILGTNQVATDLTVGTSNDTSDLFVGNWPKLAIGLRTALNIQLLKERYADTGELAFYAWYRGDSTVTRAAAFHYVEGLRPAA